MIRLATVFAAGTILAGCATNTANLPPPPDSALVPQAEAPAPAPAPAPKPEYGTFGFDTAGMDKSVAPGNDFYEYANGTWDKTTQIPADKSRYGMFNVLDDLSKTRTREIIEEQAKSPTSNIGNAYKSFMNEAAVEAKGLSPLEPWLDQVRALKSMSKTKVCTRSCGLRNG